VNKFKGMKKGKWDCLLMGWRGKSEWTWRSSFSI